MALSKEDLLGDMLTPRPAAQPKGESKTLLPEDWPAKKREDFGWVMKMVEVIESRPLDLTRSALDWKNILRAMAAFGQSGRELARRMAIISKDYEQSAFEESWQEAATDPLSSAAKFFSVCKHFEITKQSLKEAEKNKESFAELLPDGVDPNQFFKDGFYAHDTSYWRMTKDGPVCMSEFTLRVLYLVRSKTNPKRIVEIKDKYGNVRVLDLPTDAFTSIGNFKKAIESVGPFVWEGNDTDLTKLKKKLFREEKPTIEVNALGWNKSGFFAWANGIFNGKWQLADEYGIVEHKEYSYFLPFCSNILEDHDTDVFTNEKLFRHKDNPKADFSTWSGHLINVYGKDKAVIGLCFYTAALFRDYIFRCNNNFPMIYCFGMRQSGKSTWMKSFQWPFGTPQDFISLENPSSVVGAMRTLARFHNSIIVLDEYKNTVDKKTLGMLKGIYDGYGRIVGRYTNDNQTNVTKPNSAVMLAGQDMPTQDNALFTRTILLEFDEKGRNKKAFEELKNYESKGLTPITLDILRYRAEIEANYKAQINATIDRYRKASADQKIEDRTLLNMAAITAALTLLMDKGFVKIEGLTADDVHSIGLANVQNQMRKISHSTDGSRFWNVMQAAVRAGDLRQEIDYRFKDGFLLLRMSTVHPAYMQMHRQMHSTVGLDKQTIEYYLANDPAYSGKDKQKFSQAPDHPGAQPTKKVATSCLRFHYATLVEAHNLELLSDDDPENTDYDNDEAPY